MSGFCGTYLNGPYILHITTLHGSLVLLEGSDPFWPSLISHTGLSLPYTQSSVTVGPTNDREKLR